MPQTTQRKRSDTKREFSNLSPARLEKLLQLLDYARENYSFLPAVLLLAGLLNYSAIDLHDHLLLVIQKGYKILSFSLDAPITLW